MADSSAVFQSDGETGYLTDLLSSRGEFHSAEDVRFGNPADEYNIMHDGAGKPKYDKDYGDSYLGLQRSYDEKPEPSDVLDERTVVSGLSNLGWSADGTKQAYLHLMLSGRGLRDIGILETFVHLQKIDISHNEIEDLSCLGSMPYLRSLDASHNSVTVVLGFVPPLNLQYVDLSFNKILEIPDLSAHRCLHHLALNNNEISEIKGIEGCSSLSVLSLSHNKIKEIKGLDNLPIKYLNLSYNEITDIGNLKPLPRLQKLGLAGNRIQSLNGLQGVGFLESLDLQENEIIDLSELGNLKQIHSLRNLNLQQNPVLDIPDYRLAVIFTIPQLNELNVAQVTLKEKVDAINFFDPSAEYIGARDHMMHTVYSFMQPQRLLDITLPMSDTPYPMVILVGPNGIGKKSLAHKLAEEFPDYFGFAVSHTTRLPQPDEMHSRDHHFVTREEFEDLMKMGTFLQTYVYQGDLYGLSLQAVEAVASESLACITQMELEGVLTLKNSHLEPRCILILPADDDSFERRLIGKGIYSEPQIRATLARVETYRGYNQNHPGFFDVTISSDDITEAYSRLRMLVLQYLGLLDSSSDHSDTGFSLTDSHLDVDSRLTTLANISGLRGHSAPVPKRTWSRPSLHGSPRLKFTRAKAKSSIAGFTAAQGLVEEDSLQRRHSAAKEALSGSQRLPHQPLPMRTPPTSAPLNSASASRGFSAPPTQVNLEVILPDSPDSSNPLSTVESTLSDISRSDADNESIPTTEPKRTAEHRNLDVTPVMASHSVRSSLAPVRKTSSRAMSEPLDILSSRPGSVKEFKTVSAHSVQLPPINQKVH